MFIKQTFFLICLIIIVGCGKKNNPDEYTGILEGTSVKIPAMTGGKIEKCYFETGDDIKIGQPLAQIDTTELYYQVVHLNASDLEIKYQKDIQITNIQKLKSDLDYIKTKKDRVRNLVEKKSLPQQNLDDIDNQVNNMQAALKIAKQNLNNIKAKEMQISAQKKLLRKKISDSSVISTLNGKITTKYFQAGEAIPPMSPIAEIININKLETIIYISEKMLPHVKTAQKTNILVDGIEKSFQGEIIWISPKAEFTPKSIMTPETRTSLVYAVKISILNENEILKDGMPVVVQLKNQTS